MAIYRSYIGLQIPFFTDSLFHMRYGYFLFFESLYDKDNP